MRTKIAALILIVALALAALPTQTAQAAPDATAAKDYYVTVQAGTVTNVEIPDDGYVNESGTAYGFTDSYETATTTIVIVKPSVATKTGSYYLLLSKKYGKNPVTVHITVTAPLTRIKPSISWTANANVVTPQIKYIEDAWDEVDSITTDNYLLSCSRSLTKINTIECGIYKAPKGTYDIVVTVYYETYIDIYPVRVILK